MDYHVTTYFLEWSEGTISELQRKTIEHHLQSCDDCRKYFRKMSELLSPSQKQDSALLETDPFLSAKITSMMLDESRSGKVRKNYHWMQWSIAGAGVVVALVAGIVLGKGLSAASQPVKSSDLVTSYYTAFSQNGFADNWGNLTNEGGGESK